MHGDENSADDNVNIDPRKFCLRSQASFHHAYKNLKIFLNMHHTCKEYLDVNKSTTSNYMLEIEYSSIARAIVDMRADETYLYLRLTHPAILYEANERTSKKSSEGSRRTFRDFDRVTRMTHAHPTNGCHGVIDHRVLGGSNTLRLGWKTSDGILLRLHSFLAKLQGKESFIASMTTNPKPTEGMEQVCVL